MGQDTRIALSAKTATNNSGDLVKGTNQRGSHFIINMTVVPGVDTVTFTVQGKDSLGNYYTLLVSTAIVATGITVLKILPGVTASANAAAADELPDIYRILCTHSAGTSFTYSVTENSLF